MRSGWTTWTSRRGCDLLLLFLFFLLFFFVPGLDGSKDDVVDQSVLLRRIRREEVVALGVLRDLLDLLSGVARKDLVELLAGAQDLLGVDLDVARLSLHASPRLVDEDVRVRERVPLAVRTAREQDRRHRVGHADADRGDRRADVLHRVVDRQPR